MKTYYFVVCSYSGAFGASGLTYIQSFAGTNKNKANSYLNRIKKRMIDKKNFMYWLSEIKSEKAPSQYDIKQQLTKGTKPIEHEKYDL